MACILCVTPYEFGEVIAEVGGYDAELLNAGSMDDVSRDATRPAYSCLDVSRVDSTLDRSQPTLQEDVDAVRDDYGYDCTIVSTGSTIPIAETVITVMGPAGSRAVAVLCLLLVVVLEFVFR